MRSPRRRPRAFPSGSRLRSGLFASLVLSLVVGMGGSTRGADSDATSPTLILERIWPGYPEWLAMLAEILSGQTLTPDLGWFRKAVSNSRFDWPSLAERLDANRDGTIARAEFVGRSADFDRLDRDRDDVLTPADLDFSGRRRDGADIEAFITADVDGDGRLTRAELVAFARQTAADPVYRLVFQVPGQELEDRLSRLEREGATFLSLADFQEAFAITARRDPSARGKVRPPAPRTVDTPALLRAFLRQEIGALGSGPALNAPAPDFSLRTIDGTREIGLANLVGSKPVVLIFGNITCGPFRGHAGSLERLYARYKNRASFVVVYTRESHPIDGWQFEENRAQGIAVAQPRGLLERSTRAQACRVRLGLAMPVVVDSMADRVASLYSGLPSRAYLIDREGKIAYKGGRGPFGFEPASLEQSLLLLLQFDPSTDLVPDDPPAKPILLPTPPTAATATATVAPPEPPWELPRWTWNKRHIRMMAAGFGLMLAAGFAWTRQSRGRVGSPSGIDESTPETP